jgi:hypothetical protein
MLIGEVSLADLALQMCLDQLSHSCSAPQYLGTVGDRFGQSSLWQDLVTHFFDKEPWNQFISAVSSRRITIVKQR